MEKEKVFLKTEVVKEGNEKRLVRKVRQLPPYRLILGGALNKDLHFSEEESDMAANMMSGDLYLELRKAEKRILDLIEQKQETTKTVEGVKAEFNKTWRDIVDKQKVGLLYFNLLVKKYLKPKKDE